MFMQLFGLSLLTLGVGVAAAIVIVVLLSRWLKLTSVVPLIAAFYLAPVMLPTGVEASLRESWRDHPILGFLFPAPPLPEQREFMFDGLIPAEGWQVGMMVTDFKGLRFMELTSTKDLLVTNASKGELMVFKRRADGGVEQEPQVLITQLDRPQGIAVRGDWIYLAEAGRIARVKYRATNQALTSGYEIVVDNLPKEGYHARKTIDFGPDGALYVSIGSSCNVCIEEDSRSATIMRYELNGDGSAVVNEEVFASGLRYSVGFDWNSAGEMYATDNGRDLLGDDYPPDEYNRIVRGGFYGWPFVNGDGAPDPDFGDMSPPAEVRNPEHPFRAHVAALGMEFLNSSEVDGYQNSAVVALHGSWNRSSYDGYQVVSLHPKGGGGFEERVLLDGFLNAQGQRLGRPVDVIEDDEGIIYISDDYSGSLFRMAPGNGEVVDMRVARIVVEEVEITERARIELTPAQLAAMKRARGKKLYDRYCLRCHDDKPDLIPLYNLETRYDQYSLMEYILDPPPAMPVIEAVDTRGVDAISAYLLAKDLVESEKEE
ncbi:MAG: PQQ-dependent sugar dehydrogenase [Gammaproteobacteria bacterium AqS3]|nr:PQQ-dependent sugar dehydrogenase [Gammaproteobacteria bacterium AqS3]